MTQNPSGSQLLSSNDSKQRARDTFSRDKNCCSPSKSTGSVGVGSCSPPPQSQWHVVESEPILMETGAFSQRELTMTNINDSKTCLQVSQPLTGMALSFWHWVQSWGSPQLFKEGSHPVITSHKTLALWTVHKRQEVIVHSGEVSQGGGSIKSKSCCYYLFLCLCPNSQRDGRPLGRVR